MSGPSRRSLIILDTNVISETFRSTPDKNVLDWLARRDRDLALPVVVIAEIAFGIKKLIPGQRTKRLERKLTEWRHRFSGRIFGMTEEAALAYGDIKGTAARRGHTMSAPDAMIAAIARVNDAGLAMRNVADFRTTGLRLVSPWDD